MRSIGRHRALWLAGVALAGLAAVAYAQDPDDQQRGVARISLMNGDVSVKRGDASEWVAGVVNAPLMADDRIATAPNSRAEVQFDSANLIRIGGNAEVHLATLEYGRYQLEVAHGTVTYVVLRPSSVKVEVDTPSVSVRPDKRGAYRISVNEAGETQVIARAGEIEVFTPRGSEWVNTGKMMMARGSSSDPEFQIVNAPPLDEWDSWNQNRDQALMQVTSTQYVPEGVYGTEELDAYGSWTTVAPYGYVWRPRVVVADWAPYRHGRWVWEDWYGWTWVSYDPWGWAPYHYGRWFWDTGYGWCWYPGVIGRHHYWSPALVGWFGFGHGGVGFGFGHVGWVPLAPYETFHPWWGRGYYGRFDRNIHITNVNITNVYRNARVGNGISGLRYEDFHGGRFNGISRFSGDQVREAGLIRGQMPVAPSRGALNFSDRAVANAPRESRNTQFFSRERPSSVQRIPFEQQRQAFTGSRGSAPSINAQSRGGFENSRPATAGAQPQSRGGWQRFGEPSRQGSTPAVGGGGNSGFQNTRPPDARSQSRSGGGWQRFGEPSRQGAGPGNSGSPAFQNTRPSESRPQSRGGWQQFGEPGSGSRQLSPAPRSYDGGNSGARFGSPRQSMPAPRSYSPPSGSSPRGGFGGGGYSAPRSSGGGYSAPPSRGGGGFSAPRSSGGGGYSAPRSSGGGGFSAPRSSGGGGGGGRTSGGGGGGHRGR